MPHRYLKGIPEEDITQWVREEITWLQWLRDKFRWLF